MKNEYIKGISVNIILLGIVSFLNDLSSEMIMPILPMFITALGGTGLIIGLIGGLRDSVSSILKVFCGYWSYSVGKRKVFVFPGYLTSAVFKLLLSFSKVWQHVLIFAGLERVGK
ncbi:MFS transporter, partial [Candidatus Aerophobetes bacterium]